MTRIRALMYHDVVAVGDVDASGFTGGGPARYKLDRPAFDAQLAALRRFGTPAVAPFPAQPQGWALTFDDGGSSATEIGEALAGLGWCGHFFVTTDRIGTPGFLDRERVAALHAAGHVVGTHSCSHPKRFSALAWEAMVDEWRRSADVLSAIVGVPVRTGSVPGGYYTPMVGRAAAAAGLHVLFTSEPSARIRAVEGCQIVGRYAVLRQTPAASVVALVAGRRTTVARARASWTGRKVLKRVAGGAYPAVRRMVLDRGPRRS